MGYSDRVTFRVRVKLGKLTKFGVAHLRNRGRDEASKQGDSWTFIQAPVWY